MTASNEDPLPIDNFTTNIFHGPVNNITKIFNGTVNNIQHIENANFGPTYCTHWDLAGSHSGSADSRGTTNSACAPRTDSSMSDLWRLFNAPSRSYNFEQGRRLENLSWKLWFQRMQGQERKEPSPAQESDGTAFGSGQSCKKYDAETKPRILRESTMNAKALSGADKISCKSSTRHVDVETSIKEHRRFVSLAEGMVEFWMEKWSEAKANLTRYGLGRRTAYSSLLLPPVGPILKNSAPESSKKGTMTTNTLSSSMPEPQPPPVRCGTTNRTGKGGCKEGCRGLDAEGLPYPDQGFVAMCSAQLQAGAL
ncbi:hypothetical protein NMY22_g13107 [Coprinellus aureogranulatus]|nr:hypothetical protein NMY22_g13107 [Coprinellus aureogranulatus]